MADIRISDLTQIQPEAGRNLIAEYVVPAPMMMAAKNTEDRNFAIGMIVGLIAIVLGVLLLFSGVGSDAANESALVIEIGTFKLELKTVFPGLIIAAFGVAIIFISRKTIDD